VRTVDWTSATGSVAVCETEPWLNIGSFARDPTNAIVTFKDRPAQTTCATALHLMGSIDGTMVSVLTSDGRRIPSPIPFMGSSKVIGRRYVEFLDVEDGHSLTSPIELQKESKREPYGGCRTDDGRFLIYYGLFLDRLWIVEVPESVRNRKP